DTVMNGGDFEFSSEFRTPGHMAVLRAAENLLDDRQGQTEMSVELVEEAGLIPAAVICEMLDDDTGEALSKDEARAYAEANDLVFLEGKEFAKTVRV
ncbi:MAG: 3,4-dihydroxy-2-butanone-4-phosphate synthase, partial [Halobacteria archaeon]|nr:3,4-dihydroxy-2-butanone-4-phosphate synthase [Halobacteria archaeon]